MERRHSYFYFKKNQIVDGRRAIYRIVDEISENSAFAVAYRAEVISTKANNEGKLQVGDSVFIKLAKIWLHPSPSSNEIANLEYVESHLEQLHHDFNEERILSYQVPQSDLLSRVCDDGSEDVSLLDLNPFFENSGRQPVELDALSRIPFLIFPWVQGSDLRCVIEDSTYKDYTLKDRLDICKGVARALAELHQAGVVHDDLHLGNIRIYKNERTVNVVVIDFGSSRRKGHDQDKRRVADRQTFADLTFKSEVLGDIFSLGMTIISTITGAIPTSRLQGRQAVIAFLDFHALDRLKDVPLLKEVCIKCVSKAIATRYKSVEEVQQDLRLAARAAIGNIPEVSFEDVSSIWTSLDRLQSGPGSIFQEIAYYKYRQLKDLLGEMNSRCCDIYGSRQELLSYHLRFLASLRPQDTYTTLSDVEGWSELNFGCPGRILALSEQLMRQGTTINRVIFGRSSLYKYPEYRALLNTVLTEHHSLQSRLCADGIVYNVAFTILDDKSKIWQNIKRDARFGLIDWELPENKKIVYLCHLVGSRGKVGMDSSSQVSDFVPWQNLGLQLLYLKPTDANRRYGEILAARIDRTRKIFIDVTNFSSECFKNLVDIRQALTYIESHESLDLREWKSLPKSTTSWNVCMR